VYEERGTVTDASAAATSQSQRLADARVRAARRVERQRDILRPLGGVVILIVIAGALNASPHPGLRGTAFGVTLALCAFIGSTALAIGGGFTARGDRIQAAVIAVMGAAAVALAALQSQGTAQFAGGAAVWMAVARLPLGPGVALGAAIGVALDVATILSSDGAAALLTATLVVALLGLIAYFIKQARTNQDRAELLLAELEDARDEQAQAAASAERGRIAGELHDVLAHSLSGAAIQLQVARKLAEREGATPPMRAAIERSGELVKAGLANARQAVGALRGDELPGVGQLDALIASFRDDMAVDATLAIEGHVRPLGTDVSLTLYRGAQEALTNVARYAPRASTRVVLRYGEHDTTLCVEDRVEPAAEHAHEEGLSGIGGGRGLAGLRERVERIGGRVEAGSTGMGWRVELVVPA
jgi:signal transduction histidine kinase